MCWRVDDWAGVLGGGRRLRWTGRASGRVVQGLGDRVWVGWDVGLVEYQYEGGRKGIAKCLVHLRMKQIYLYRVLLSTLHFSVLALSILDQPTRSLSHSLANSFPSLLSHYSLS